MSEVARNPQPAAEKQPSARVPSPARGAPPPRPPLDDGDGSGGGEGGHGGDGGRRPARRRLRLKKLRVALLLTGLGMLAGVSTVFGMMMAVASELPELEQPPNRNSELVDVNGRRLGLLTGSERRVYLPEARIAPVMKHAIIAIEDRRFYYNEGVDFRGIARALWQDIVARRAVQGGSTITQQFVKNALAAQNERTVFNKLREAALAYHLTREWSKARILGNYLNTIYFGNGAYGIESAARTYFGTNHAGCEADRQRPCAAQLEPHEAALLAGVVASPSGYDPLTNPHESRQRRDVVLALMLEQGYLSREQHDRAVAEVLPQRNDVRPPRENTRFPYFTAWVKPQVVDALGGGQEGAQQAFEGGLRVQTTLDSQLQEAAQAAIARQLPDRSGPRAAMVVLDNETGEVRAMVGGDDHARRPFNLATQGQRQPGSIFKPFVLAAALESGIPPDSRWESERRQYCITRRRGKCVETFVVNNYEDVYRGSTSLREATTSSDNAVYAEVGQQVGLGRIARLARRMGVRTPVSRNHAMTLGGLEQGVTPLDMARAYQAFARDGNLLYGSMSPGARTDGNGPVPGPAAIHAIRGPDGKAVELPDGSRAVNRERRERVLPADTARVVQGMLRDVVLRGTAFRAAMPATYAAGKTGTTENYGDAWFVGWTERYTAAVWVGYPDKLVPMEDEFGGDPVAGGTYPALIWRSFMEAAERIHDEREPDDDEETSEPGPVETTAPPAPAQESQSDAPPAPPAPSGGSAEGAAPADGGGAARPPQSGPEPEREPAPPEAETSPGAPAPRGGGAGAPEPSGDAPE